MGPRHISSQNIAIRPPEARALTIARLDAGATLAQVAERAGYTPTLICFYERGFIHRAPPSAYNRIMEAISELAAEREAS